MKKKPQIIVYIFLNIIISTVTILFVMWLWDRAHTQETSQQMDNPLTSAPASTLPSANTINDAASEPTPEFINEDYQVSILAIVGSGNLDLEYVEISNQSQGALDLSGWQLVDEDGQTFTFPTIILNEGGAIKILSKKGINTVIELYWQSDSPIWESGETARLLDDNGDVVATYSIP